MTDTCGHPTQGGDGPPCQNPATEGTHCWLDAHGGDTTPGRPSEPAVGKEVMDAITSRIAEGKSDTEAFRQANLHPSTKGNWLGKIDDPEDVPADPDFDTDPYGYFFRRYTHARGLGESWYVENIMDMAMETSDISTLMSMLKQRYPESWGDVDRGEQASGSQINLYDRAPEDIDAIVDALRE